MQHIGGQIRNMAKKSLAANTKVTQREAAKLWNIVVKYSVDCFNDEDRPIDVVSSKFNRELQSLVDRKIKNTSK